MTVCTGTVLFVNGSTSPTVLSLVGYFVMCPKALTDAISAARRSPLAPPLMVAVSLDVGSDKTAFPLVYHTYLQCKSAKVSYEPFQVKDNKRPEDVQRKYSLHSWRIMQPSIELPRNIEIGGAARLPQAGD